MQRSNFINQTASREAFAARLTALADHYKSVDQFAKKIGVSPSALRKWLKGEAEPRRDLLVAVAQAAGVSVEWLATGRGPVRRGRAPAGLPPGLAEIGLRYQSAAEFGPDYVVLPNREATISTRESAPLRSSQIVDDLAFKVDFVHHRFDVDPEHLLLIEAAADATAGTIRKRDLLLVDTADPEIHDNALYVFDLNGELVIKRIRKKLDGTLVISRNGADAGIEEVAPSDVSSLQIVGRVVWFGRLL